MILKHSPLEILEKKSPAGKSWQMKTQVKTSDKQYFRTPAAIGCAAVSAILYALAGGLENLAYPVKWRIESGCAEIPIPDSADASTMRLMAEVGLRQLAGARDDIRILDD